MLVAYAWFVAAVVVTIRRRDFRRPQRWDGVARFAGALAGLLAVAGAIDLLRGNPSTLGRVLLAALLAGGLDYLCGIALWRRRAGVTLRWTGWALCTCALLVPSTLSLLLPIAGLLVVTLPAPDDAPAVTGPAPG